MPEPVLARGYLRHYAILGLNPEPLLELFPRKTEPPTALYLPPCPHFWQRIPAILLPLRLLSPLVALGILGWFVWGLARDTG